MRGRGKRGRKEEPLAGRLETAIVGGLPHFASDKNCFTLGVGEDDERERKIFFFTPLLCTMKAPVRHVTMLARDWLGFFFFNCLCLFCISFADFKNIFPSSLISPLSPGGREEKEGGREESLSSQPPLCTFLTRSPLGAAMAEPTYAWAYSLVDSSQVSTFLISILLIVYGSFRSLNMDFENQEKDKDGNTSSATFNVNNTNNSIQTIDSTQALFLPIGASVSLLVMFFFFDSVQVVFTICTAVLATIAFAFLLLPMCQYLTRACTTQNKISFGCCGRFTAAELLSFTLSVILVLIWVLTGHWLLMDALAMGLCVAMIAFVRLPSLKVSCLLLSGLLIYDVFWVFFSAYIFNSNVMVKVATQPADNPLDVLSRKLHLGPNVGRDVPRLSLPGKLVFPSSTGTHFSMLGIGDIVMPGLLLCFVLRYDNYKKLANSEAIPAIVPGRMQKVSYFHCTLIGYFIGLLTATVASRIHRAAQPALLYLVPFTLLPLLTMAYLKGDLRRMWSEPFHTKAQSSRFLEVW